MASKELPNYTKGEEIFNAVTHIVGGGFGIAALVLGIIFSVIYSDGYGLFSMIVYGISMIILYTMSSLYHFLPKGKAKRLFRIFDHCSVFLLISGTYTPYCLVSLREQSSTLGWTLFFVVWGISLVGIALNAINMHSKVVKTASMICYLGEGWCVIFAIKTLIKAITIPGFILLLSGGIVYTIGAVLYGLGKKKKFMHSVWHLFCLFGTALQFLSILFFVII